MALDALDPTTLPDPYPITPINGRLDAIVTVPGSKSITNRALVCAALAQGTSRLEGALFADDTEAMVGVLGDIGLDVATDRLAERITVTGCGGRLPDVTAGELGVDVGQSGTTARFALPMLALGTGRYRVTAHPQMLARPMDATFAALVSLGAGIEALDGAGTLPVLVSAGGLRSGVIEVPGDVSSQFLSGLLLAAPCLPEGLVIEVSTPLVSRPYVELTISVMETFGATVERGGTGSFAVAAGGYTARRYQVEPDASAATYPWAAAAICGGRVRVDGLGSRPLQGDAAFVDVLGAMGATVDRDERGTAVTAEPRSLRGGDFDLADLSDTAQTLAVVAPFAAEPVTVRGIGFIRRKETDRVAAVATELRRCGIEVTVSADGWTIRPGAPRAATIETYHDHRMAMSFALLGLATPGTEIANPACVAKTFPGFWALLAAL